MVKSQQLGAVHVPGAQQTTVLPRQVTSMPATTSAAEGLLGGIDMGELMGLMITMMIIVMMMKMMTGAMGSIV